MTIPVKKMDLEQGDPPLELGSQAWLDSLTAVSQAVGSDVFEARLFQLLNRILPVDHCAVFTFNQDTGQNAEAGHLFTTSRMGDDAASALAEDYIGGYFARDPNFPRIRDLTALHATSHDGTPQGLIPMKSGGAYDKTYRQHFFEQTSLIDKASTIMPSGQDMVYCNFYRMQESGHYSPEDWLQLERILPLVTSLISTHYRLNRKLPYATGSGDKASKADNPQSLVHSVIGMAIPPFDHLTPRERDVCARILLGFTSEAIALDLGIASSSVITYRKRAYARLGIVSQNELFSCCLAAIDRT